MPAPAMPTVTITDFPGIMENVDPLDFPDGGAEEQVNATSFKYGELIVRHGVREITFES